MSKRVISLILTALLIIVAAAPAVRAEEAPTTAAAEVPATAAAEAQTTAAEAPATAAAEAQTTAAETPTTAENVAAEAAEQSDQLPDVIPNGVYDGDEEEPLGDGEILVAERVLPCYVANPDVNFELTAYFINGVDDLPFVDLKEWIDVMVTLEQLIGDRGYSLSMEAQDYLVQLTRENGYSMLFDFQNEEILIENYDAFIHSSEDSSLIDLVVGGETDEEGNPLLIEKINRGSFDRSGRQVDISLSDYQIPMHYVNVEGKDLYLLPLQTLADITLALLTNLYVIYNGNGVFFTLDSVMGGDTGELTPLGEVFYSTMEGGEMSEELAWYNYCELCLALDYLYGLKDTHDITTFDRTFTETGYRDDLCSTDPGVADGALLDFINYYLDDLHSGFNFASYRVNELVSLGGNGLSGLTDSKNGEIYGTARNAADHEILSYEEFGNTAYITFDNFYIAGYPQDYYEGNIEVSKDPADPTLDTIALIIYAHEQITREDSPIENVVLDLSNNVGGMLESAIVVGSWFLGEAPISIKDNLTGAISTGTYRADINLDGVYDEQDSISNKHLYCLISPYSFSCANLIPNLLKSSNQVTLLGRTSGGGSCSVLHLGTADGATFQISSPLVMSHLKNGSYYNTDRGIDPDFVIAKPENFYNREALTEYINQLF